MKNDNDTGRALFEAVARLRRLRLANDLTALALALAGLVLLAASLVAVFFWSGWVVLAVAVPAGWLAFRWLSGLGVKGLARQIEGGFAKLRGRLVPALELAGYETGSKEGYSAELIRAAITVVEADVHTLPLGRLVERRRVLWAGAMLAVGLVFLVGYLVLFPERSRIGLVNAFAPGALPVSFSVEPGDTALLPGAEVALKCRVEPAGVFRSVVLERSGPGLGAGPKSAEGAARSAERRKVVLDAGQGQVTVRPREGFRYRFRALSRASDEHRVSIIEPVSVRRLVFRYKYPEYSQLPDFQSSSTEIAALKGTRVEVEGEASREIAAGRIVLGNDTVRLEVAGEGTGLEESKKSEVRSQKWKGGSGTGLEESKKSEGRSQKREGDGTGFRGSFILSSDREGRIELNAGTVFAEFQPAENLRVRVMPDEPPLVKLFFPGRDVDLPMSMQIALGIVSLDDFGLEGLYLFQTRENGMGAGFAGRSDTTRTRVKSLAGRREDTTFYSWDLSGAGLLPGDVMSYWVGVTDNDVVSGPKMSRTEAFRVRFPTMTEIYNASVRRTERTSEELGPMQESQEKLGEEMERMSRQLMQEGNLSWDERQALQQVLADQGELVQQIEQMRDDVAELLDELSAGMQLDEETLERMGELQELLSRLLPEELQQSLARLAQELEKQSPDLRKALSEFKLNQDQLKQSIAQALEFLNRVLEEQRLEALARKAEELAKTQEDLLSRLGAEDGERLAGMEQELGRALDSLHKEMEDLAETMSDSATGDSLSELAEGMKQDSLSALAGQTGQAMKKGDNKQARSQGRKLQKKLESLSKSLGSMSQGLKKKRSNDVARRLLLTAEELLSLSRRQEELSQDSAALPVVQMGLHDGTRVGAESLAALGSRTMSLSPRFVQELDRAMRAMQDAAQSLVESRQGQASRQMRTSRASLDRVVGWLLAAAEEAQQGGGMSGGMEGMLAQLSQMTAEQMAINAGMGGMPIPVPGGLTGAQMAALERVMSQQAGLRERLEQMLHEMGGQQPGLTSSLEGALEDMKQVERDLAEMNVTRELLERQESILSRLLDAQRSVRQRGFKEERERETAKAYAPGISPRMPQDAGERNRMLREELMRSLKDAQFGEYQRMIRAYFEQLMNQP